MIGLLSAPLLEGAASGCDDGRDAGCCRRHPKLPACTKPRAGTAKTAALPSDDTIALARASCSADASPSYHAMACLHDDCPPDPTAALQRARFPEEEATLAFDAARTPKAGLAYQTAGTRERLLRRIVATLYRHGVINASANIIEAGMAIGDNAVPWASMLSRLRPAGARGTVFAVDPMARNCDATRRLAQANRLANLCVLQRAIGDGPGFAAIKQRKGPKLQIPQISLDALDALPFGPASPALGFVHLDVEGFEARALRGAQRLIARHRPVVVTERHAGDRFDDGLLLRHSYRVAEVPEICGPNLSCRNRLWLPAERWDEAMRLVGAELRRPLVPEHSPTLAAVV